MKETKGDRAKKLVLRASIDLFSEKGFATASFREIAERAGVKTHIVSNHFENKYAIYRACIDAVSEHFVQIYSTLSTIEDNALTRLKNYFLSNLVLADEYPQEVKIIVFLYSTAAHDERFRDIYTEVVRQTRLRYLEAIYCGLREKTFTLTASPETVSEIIHEQIIGSIVNYLSSEHRTDEKARLKLKWAELVMSLTGIKPNFT